MQKIFLSMGLLSLFIGSSVLAMVQFHDSMNPPMHNISVNKVVSGTNNYEIKEGNYILPRIHQDLVSPRMSKEHMFNGPSWLYPVFLLGRCVAILLFLGAATYVVRRSWVLASKK
jgi:flagellar biogenesis protein FliO